MNPTLFHISLYTFASLGTLFSGLTIGLLLWFTKRDNQLANRLLSLALVAMALKVAGLPSLLLLVPGPLLYFYVRRLTCPERRFRWKDGLHFCPLLAGYWMPGWLILISPIFYLYLSHRLIEHFYDWLQPILMDRPRFAYRHLDRMIFLLGLICILWLLNDIFSFAAAFVLIGMGARVMVKPDISVPLPLLMTDASDAKQKGRRLREAVAAGRFFEDAELTLAGLAVKLAIPPHDLSRIINLGLRKNFSDFINEFRVREIVRKLQDPACDRLTLLGIAYETGFNSKTTFNRVFKEMTGKTPLEYKNGLKKEVPIDKLALRSQIRPVLLRTESLTHWAAETPKRNHMLRNYFRIAYRSLLKNKGFTAINILGLSAGLATCLLIVLYVVDELSYDRYNVNARNIYRITEQVRFNGNEATYPTAEAPLAGSIENLPQIEKYARFLPIESLFISPRKYFVRRGNEEIEDNHLVFAGSNIFDVFTLPMTEGNPRDALTEPHSVVITESAARKYFGKTNVLGQTLTLNDTSNYKVTGVIKDIPAQSHFHYDFFVSLSSIPEGKMNNWGFSGFHTYVELKPGTDVKSLEAAITKIDIGLYPPKLWSTGSNYLRLVLTPLLDIHLHSTGQYELSTGGSIQYVYIFSAIAIFIFTDCLRQFHESVYRTVIKPREGGGCA